MAHTKNISALNDNTFRMGHIHIKTLTPCERMMFFSDMFYAMKAGEISEPEFLCHVVTVDSMWN